MPKKCLSHKILKKYNYEDKCNYYFFGKNVRLIGIGFIKKSLNKTCVKIKTFYTIQLKANKYFWVIFSPI